MNAEALPLWKGILLVTALMMMSMIFVITGIAVIVFLVRVPIRRYKPLELSFFDWLHKHTSPWRNRFMLFITFLGKHQFLIPANLVLLFYFLFFSKYSWFSVRIAAISLSSLGLMLLLKQLFRRKRPLAPLLKAAKGLSFPSGHAIMAVTFYGLLIYIISNTVTIEWLKHTTNILLLILIILIGFSRIYLRVHYVTDVVAGFLVGLLWLYISLGVLNKLETFIKEKKTIPSAGIKILSTRD